MVTSAALHRFLNMLNITVHIRDVCVFLAPSFRYLFNLHCCAICMHCCNFALLQFSIVSILHCCNFNFYFSGLTAIATYFLTKELWNSRAGLFAACFIAIGNCYVVWFAVQHIFHGRFYLWECVSLVHICQDLFIALMSFLLVI